MPRRHPRRRYSVMLCPCPRFALCNPCRDSLYMQRRGTAACRGEGWADRVAREVPRDRAWPPHEDRAAEIAERLVSDLSRDPDLRGMLAAELAHWAARRWSSR